jgi:hypothetical protein
MHKYKMLLANLLLGTLFSPAAQASAGKTALDMALGLAGATGAFETEIHPYLEKRENDEAKSVLTAAVTMFKIAMATAPDRRDAHAKGHGCARAELTVANELPAALRAGFLAEPGKTYPTIVRLSNGAGQSAPDRAPDGRGMALKIIGGAASGNILGTGFTQDFLMINNPRFFLGSLADFAKFNLVIAQDRKPDRFFLERAVFEALTESDLRKEVEKSSEVQLAALMAGVAALAADPTLLPKNIAAAYPHLSAENHAALFRGLVAKAMQLKQGTAPVELKIARELLRPIGSALTESYHSMTSYLAASGRGEGNDTAVKLSLRPVDCTTGKEKAPAPHNDSASDNALADDLAQRLSRQDACFDLNAQALPNISGQEKAKLVEDPRLDYGTPEVRLGRLLIPAQAFGRPEGNEYCEALSFNPWQASPELRPLGALNRARKLAVTVSSIRRHFVTGKARQEPASMPAELSANP